MAQLRQFGATGRALISLPTNSATQSRTWVGQLWAAGIAAVVLAGLMLAAGGTGLGQLTRIAPDRFWVLDPGAQNQARQIEAALVRRALSDQFDWNRSAARQFHLRLKAGEAGSGDLAVFAPVVGGSVVLHINGVAVAEGQAAATYGGPGFGRAVLAAALPAPFLDPGDNRIDLLVADDRPHAGLRALYLGPVAAVEQVAQASAQRTRLLQRGAQLATLAALLCAALMALLSGERLRSAGSAAVGAALLCALLAPAWPTWLLTQLSATLAVIGGGISLHVWRDPQGWEGRINLGIGAAATLTALLGGALVFAPLMVPAPFEAALVANGGVILLGLIAMPLSLVEDLRKLLQRLRRVGIDLAEKDRMIRDQQAQLEQQIRNAAVLEERQRFTRDMHDGIGGQLQSLLMRVRSNRIGQTDIAGEIQKGLTDLRLVVDSLDAVETDLYAALETFHIRVGQQVEAAGVRLEWDLAQEVHAVRIEAREVLNIYRILQESVTNCLRHAQAEKLSITISTDEQHSALFVRVEDDGRGFDPALVKAGKGLIGLRQRSAKMAGTLEIGPGAGGKGTCVAATLSLGRAAGS
jgi:signal transduction histidine kinase